LEEKDQINQKNKMLIYFSVSNLWESKFLLSFTVNLLQIKPNAASTSITKRLGLKSKAASEI
jgi:hypothetical protein